MLQLLLLLTPAVEILVASHVHPSQQTCSRPCCYPHLPLLMHLDLTHPPPPVPQNCRTGRRQQQQQQQQQRYRLRLLPLVVGQPQQLLGLLLLLLLLALRLHLRLLAALAREHAEVWRTCHEQ
jgi:hypothetical protein